MKQSKTAICISLLIIVLISSIALYRIGVFANSPRVQPQKGNLVPVSTSTAPIPQISQIKAYVNTQAEKDGISVWVADYIVQHESAWDPTKLGDDSQSRGLWQIDFKYHPEIDDHCAFSVACSTNWSLNQIKAGHIRWWSSWDWYLSHK